MKKLAKKRFLRGVKKGLRKVGTFFKILWRDRLYLVTKIAFLMLFAVMLTALNNPNADQNVAGFCSAAVGLICLIPTDRILPEEDPHKTWRKKRQARKEKEV